MEPGPSPTTSGPVHTMGVRELRANLSTVLRRAGEGEQITVTVDGVPVARIVPVQPGGAPTLDDLVATGLVTAPRRSAPTEPTDVIDPAVDIRLEDVLDELRGR